MARMIDAKSLKEELKGNFTNIYYDRLPVDVVTTIEEHILDKIRAEIEKYKSSIDKAISEDELKIEGMKEAYTDCLEIIDKYKAESEKGVEECL